MPKIIEDNYYNFVILYDFTRFNKTILLAHKEETFTTFIRFAKLIQNQFFLKIICLRSDHTGEFVNNYFDYFCTKKSYNFSCSCTPQHNGVMERKNRSLEELA